MKEINLLPDRNTGLSLHISAMAAMSSFLALLLVLLVATSGYLLLMTKQQEKQLSTRQSERETLRNDIEEANSLQLKLAYILDRKKIFADLQAANSEFGPVMQEIASASPATLKLTSLSMSGDNGIKIDGTAASRADIASFTDKLSKNTHFSNVTLTQANSQPEGVNFTVNLDFGKPKASPEGAPSGSNPRKNP